MLETQPANPSQLVNQVGQLFLSSLEEVIGPNGVKSVLRSSNRVHLLSGPDSSPSRQGFQAADLAAIHQSMEEVFGHNGGRGLALRTGQAFFKYGMRELGPILGMTNSRFRLLPMRAKLRLGTQAIGSIFSMAGSRILRMDETATAYRWHMTDCPACQGRRTSEPACHFTVGLLQEAFSWLSCGRSHVVDEVHCIAMGDRACVIDVQRHPLA